MNISRCAVFKSVKQSIKYELKLWLDIAYNRNTSSIQNIILQQKSPNSQIKLQIQLTLHVSRPPSSYPAHKTASLNCLSVTTLLMAA